MSKPKRSEIHLKKSSYSSANGSCVAAGAKFERVYVADTKDPQGPMLDFSPSDWGRFTASIAPKG